MQIRELFDQSVFVRASIKGVLREAVIAAALTGLMILLFLGSWRSTVIIAISIPLSILSSLAMLSFLGHTMNVMTLGGLALAIGILVDDATVTIENIHRHMGRKPLREAVLDGAAQIATPTFVATLTICIVFVSVVFLTGPAKYLFTPMALAVVFAMIASYILSRTLVPVLAAFLLRSEQHEVNPETGLSEAPEAHGWFGRLNARFNDGYIAFRTRYTALLQGFLRSRKTAFLLSGTDRRLGFRPAAVRGPRLLSAGGRGTVSAARARRSGAAAGEHQGGIQPGRRGAAQGDPRVGDRTDPGQYRPARRVVQLRVRRWRHDRHFRRRDPGGAEGRPARANGGIYPRAAP